MTLPLTLRSGKQGVPKRVASLTTQLDSMVLELAGDKPIHRCSPRADTISVASPPRVPATTPESSLAQSRLAITLTGPAGNAFGGMQTQMYW